MGELKTLVKSTHGSAQGTALNNNSFGGRKSVVLRSQLKPQCDFPVRHPGTIRTEHLYAMATTRPCAMRDCYILSISERPAGDCVLHSFKVHVGVHRLTLQQHERPVFKMTASVDDGEHSVANISNLIAAGKTCRRAEYDGRQHWLQSPWLRWRPRGPTHFRRILGNTSLV
jgi:hypothetical protein